MFGSLSEVFKQWSILRTDGLISAADMTGAMLLCMMAMRKQKKWIAGVLKDAYPPRESSVFDALPGLVELVNEGNYLSRRLSAVVKRSQDSKSALATIDNDWLRLQTISSVFELLQFSGIKHNSDNYINSSMCEWWAGNRPFELMYDIPSPMRVLRMQSRGYRVITVFLESEELNSMHSAKLYYMENSDATFAKDAFDFTIHDMKHMEHFMDPNTRKEQVTEMYCAIFLRSFHFTALPMTRISL